MNLIYDYYGLLVYFRDEAELPMTVYGSRGGRESAICIHFSNGLMQAPEMQTSANELDEEDAAVFKLLVDKNSSEIIKLWLDIFLYGKKPEPEIIRQNIREQ